MTRLQLQPAARALQEREMGVGGLLKAVWGLPQPCPSPPPQPRPASRTRMPSKHPRTTRDLESPRRARRQPSVEKQEEEAHPPFSTARAVPPSSHGDCPCLGRERPGSSFSGLNLPGLSPGYYHISHWEGTSVLGPPLLTPCPKEPRKLLLFREQNVGQGTSPKATQAACCCCCCFL